MQSSGNGMMLPCVKGARVRLYVFIFLCLQEKALKDTLKIKNVDVWGGNSVLLMEVNPLHAHPFVILMFKSSGRVV